MAIGFWLKNFPKWYFDPDIEGGGGGSSDFSTATMTIVNNTSYTGAICSGAICFEANETPLNVPCAYWQIPTVANTTTTAKLVLYKGLAVVDNTTVALFTLISGDIEAIGNNSYRITGDCTVTISE